MCVQTIYFIMPSMSMTCLRHHGFRKTQINRHTTSN